MTAKLRAMGKTVEVCSSDAYFICPCCKAYNWFSDRLADAHKWCQRKFSQALENGVEFVFVDNTNITPKECRPYVLMAEHHGYEIRFLEPTTSWAFDLDELERRNQHGVPRHGLERMLARWVPNMTVEKALGDNVPGQPTPDERAAG